jgi:hypothetical protein
MLCKQNAPNVCKPPFAFIDTVHISWILGCASLYSLLFTMCIQPWANWICTEWKHRNNENTLYTYKERNMAKWFKIGITSIIHNKNTFYMLHHRHLYLNMSNYQHETYGKKSQFSYNVLYFYMKNDLPQGAAISL